MDLEGIMLSEISQTKKDKYCMISPNVESKKIQPTSEYSKKEADSQIQRTSDYQWGEGRREGQDKARRLRATNHYV